MRCLTKSSFETRSEFLRFLPIELVESKTLGLLGAFAVGVFVFANSQETNAAVSKQCLKTKITPEIVIMHDDVDTQLIHTKSSQQITGIAKKVNAYRPQKGSRLLGLAFTEVKKGIRVEVDGKNISGKICARLTKVIFEFGKSKSAIYVSKKYRPGTCEYRVILAHEKQHMAINARVQKKYAAKLEKALIRSAKNMKPISSSNINNVPKIYANRLSNSVKGILKSFQQERRRENAKIDTPQSYAKTRSKCAKW